jgi:hypothetical protein
MRRLSTLLSALSLLLCVAAVFMWVRSEGTQDQVWHLTWGPADPDGYHRRTIRGVRSGRGVATISVSFDRVGTALYENRQIFVGEGRDGFHWQAEPVVADDPRVERIISHHLDMYPERPPSQWQFRWWSLAATAGVFPTAWLFARFWRTRRRKPGVCQSCRYDLRATPGRCPECGTAAAGKEASPAARPPAATPAGRW